MPSNTLGEPDRRGLHDFAGVAHEILAQVFGIPQDRKEYAGRGMLGKTVYGKAAILAAHLANGRLAVGRVGMIMNVCNYHGLTLVVCFGPSKNNHRAAARIGYSSRNKADVKRGIRYLSTSRTCFRWERTGQGSCRRAFRFASSERKPGKLRNTHTVPPHR